MILVTGATGHLGAAVIEQLLKKTDSANVVAFARDEAKAKHLTEKGVEVRYGSFDDTASLDKAMRGIEKVFLISTTAPNRFDQHKNVVNAARNAGVKFIAYTSAPRKDLEKLATKPLFESHYKTEDYIMSSGLNYVFLRNTIYTDMIPLYASEKVFETGIHLPAGEAKLAFALRREMGEATANLLLQSESHHNKAYDITNVELYSFDDVARALSELSGRTVIYKNTDAETFKSKLQERGLPEAAALMLTALITDIKNHHFESVTNDLTNLVDRKPMPLKEALKEIYRL